MGGVLVCAHTGFNGTPEGSLASLRAGAAAGYPVAEVDVRLTRDGIPVLHHDAALSCMPDAPIDGLRWAELSALRPGLVLFSKALTLTRALGLSLNIDLKTPLAAEPCAALCVHSGIAGRCYFSGLYPNDARAVAEQRLRVDAGVV
ncbi:MAG TPA: glycerophosphodiester phosphodiesterase family protein, partial [Clostridia bacterium]|nr:glycerophosphodiester phosphodiesterase family protein [Clostridia bacterium]